MSKTTVQVVSRLCAKADQAAALKQLLVDSSKEISKEPGCISFEVFENQSDPTDLVCLEQWENSDLLDAHRDAPQTHVLHDAIEPLIAAPLDIHRYQNVSNH